MRPLRPLWDRSMIEKLFIFSQWLVLNRRRQSPKGLVQCDESEQLPCRMCQSHQCKSSEMMILLIQVQLRRRPEDMKAWLRTCLTEHLRWTPLAYLPILWGVAGSCVNVRIVVKLVLGEGPAWFKMHTDAINEKKNLRGLLFLCLLFFFFPVEGFPAFLDHYLLFDSDHSLEFCISVVRALQHWANAEKNGYVVSKPETQNNNFY